MKTKDNAAPRLKPGVDADVLAFPDPTGRFRTTGETIMKLWGTGLLLVGLLLACGSLLMDTSVGSGASSYLGGSSQVYNLGLLQHQQLLFGGGCALFIAGAIFMVGGAIEDALRHRVAVGSEATTEYQSSERRSPRRMSQEESDQIDDKNIHWIIGTVVVFAIIIFVAFVLR